jgi:hypothetical protein
MPEVEWRRTWWLGRELWVKLAKKKRLRRWPQADETYFLNVDLLSRHSLEPLVVTVYAADQTVSRAPSIQVH